MGRSGNTIKRIAIRLGALGLIALGVLVAVIEWLDNDPELDEPYR